MAISQYTDKDENRYYKVTVSMRSKSNPTIRAQRQATTMNRAGKVEKIKTHAQAKAVEKSLKEEALRELWDREQKGCSWGTLVDQWIIALSEGRASDRPLGPGTIEDYRRALEIYTQGWWDRTAREIGPVDVKQVMQVLADQGKSDSRKRAVKNAINQCFMWGIEAGWIKGITQSPTLGVKINRDRGAGEHEPDILTLNEIKKLLEAAKLYQHPWYPIWAVALHTGMRSGELHALQWSDVDDENRKIRVSKSYNGRLKAVTPTKGRYWREVPINVELERSLRELRTVTGNSPHVLPRFPDWDRGEQARTLREFCTGIGITPVKFHALRACFATQLLRAKAPPAVVMKICGWKELKTMQYYIRLAGLEIEGATDGLRFLTEREAVAEVVPLFS